jgi:hypothetical protein
MLEPAQREQLKPHLRTMQIIVGALAFGVVNFLVVALWIVLSGNDPPVVPPSLTYVAIGAAVIAVVASFVVPSIIAGPLKRQMATDESASSLPVVTRHAAVYQTMLIIRCAILEGAAFFCLVSYLVEHHIAGPVAATLLLLVIVAQIPTHSRLESWIEYALVESNQLGQLGDRI